MFPDCTPRPTSVWDWNYKYCKGMEFWQGLPGGEYLQWLPIVIMLAVLAWIGISNLRGRGSQRRRAAYLRKMNRSAPR